MPNIKAHEAVTVRNERPTENSEREFGSPIMSALSMLRDKSPPLPALGKHKDRPASFMNHYLETEQSNMSAFNPNKTTGDFTFKKRHISTLSHFPDGT